MIATTPTKNWQKKFPPDEGWIRASMTLMSSAQMSEQQMERLASFGNRDNYEFGELFQNGNKFIAIMRSKKQHPAAAQEGGEG